MKSYLIAPFVAGNLAAAHAGTQDVDLSAARELYASAAYDEALAALNRLSTSEHPSSQSRAIEQYRAFCLLALGRVADAERAIEAVVVAEPLFQPDENDASPRIRSAFTAVRRRVLPSIIQKKYAEAKRAFDRKEFAAASDGFAQVVTALADQEIAAEAKQPPLADLLTLASGFQELAARATPSPPPPLPAPAPAPAPIRAEATPAEPRIYTGSEPGFVAPVILSQALPPFPGQVIVPRKGKVEIVIDESGLVESAVMREAVTPAYDAIVLAAARTWRYRPATVNGVPVKFRKTLQITVKITS